MIQRSEGAVSDDSTPGRHAELADQLFEIGAVQFGVFRLKHHETHPDAPLSLIYLNLRTANHPKNPGPLTEEVMVLVGELFAALLTRADSHFRRFADIPDAGGPFDDLVRPIADARGLNQPRVTLKKVFLPDGQRRISQEVQGEYVAGEVCLVVDELITQADSKQEAIRALEAAGLVVHDVLVLVDRMQGGGEQLWRAGYRLLAVFTLGELLDHYVERGFITAERRQEVVDYLNANRAA